MDLFYSHGNFQVFNVFLVLFSDLMHIRKELGMGPWPDKNNGRRNIVQIQRLRYEKMQPKSELAMRTPT